VTARVPAPPQVDLVPAAERYFDLVQRAVEMNRRLSLRWLQAASALSGAVREQADTAARARARYEGMTKAGLTDLLAKRDLPKTGNVDELIERLVEADGK
jgi:hypothetical protein